MCNVTITYQRVGVFLMGKHLEGYASRFTKRAIANKERAKSKKFAKIGESPSEEIFVDNIYLKTLI